jgi:pyruvate dehydrogenase (quinone)
MSGNGELLTIAKYWREWSNAHLIIAVLHNNDLNMVTWEQRIMEGDPKFEASQNLPNFEYAKYAELLGLRGIRVDREEEIGRVWDEALAENRPTVLEFITDPEVPPLPPHISLEQAKSFASSILKRDPNAGEMIRQSLKQLADTWLPGKSD